jgi:hypothetical protein
MFWLPRPHTKKQDFPSFSRSHFFLLKTPRPFKKKEIGPARAFFFFFARALFRTRHAESFCFLFLPQQKLALSMVKERTMYAYRFVRCFARLSHDGR